MTDETEARALTHALDHIDIYSSSWGPRDDGECDRCQHCPSKQIKCNTFHQESLWMDRKHLHWKLLKKVSLKAEVDWVSSTSGHLEMEVRVKCKRHHFI